MNSPSELNPRPWKVHIKPVRGDVCGHVCVRDAQGDAVGLSHALYGDEDADRIAEFNCIVLAVNAHDALVAACERIARNGECTCHDGGPGFQCDVCEARAALAKATG